MFATELAADGSSLRYSTYLGGSNDDEATGVVVDSSGNLVLTGRAASGYPTKNAYDSSHNGGTYDMIITRLNPGASGSSSLLYATFLGATSSERGYAIATAGGSVVYVAGSTYNSGFPTKNAYDSSQNGGADVLVVKLDPALSGSASLLYSTYLGGSSSDEGLGIAADSSGNAYVTGYANSGFPLVNAAQATYGGNTDAFVAKLNTLVSGSAGLVSSTYLGGSAEDQGTAITLTGDRQVAITGLTRSDNYPTRNPTQAARGGDSCTTTPCEDAVVSQLTTTGPVTAQLTFSSYAGGAQDDDGRGIAHDSAGALYLTGVTFSATTGGTNSDAFLHKYTLSGGGTPPVTPQPYDETYTYDQIGNLTSKAGVGYGYGANGNGTGAGPHQARTVGLQSYSYDANGNLLSGGGRTLTWDTENRVASVTANGVTETSAYDANGERVTKTSGGVTTLYLEGVWEEAGTATKITYMAGSHLVAVRDSGTNAVTYLHSDHLGSVSLATTNNGSGPAVASEQLFTPWGQVRAGGIGQTTLNYTGQRLDNSGLLYYHARYYDPALARFVSADSVVPGAGALTTTPHDATAQAAWGQHTGGPANPQALNRYSYVDNHPVGTTDATGHCGGDGIGSSICDGGSGVPIDASNETDVEALAASEPPAAAAEPSGAWGEGGGSGGRNGNLTIYGTGNTTQGPKARPGIDVPVDEQGYIVKGQAGASASESIENIQTRGRVYKKMTDPDDPDIVYTPDGGQPNGRGDTHPPDHVSAVPRRDQTFDNYQQAHQRGWQPARDPETGEHLISPRGK